jgi:3-oxoacyl-[acyl-carrier-protein] synthase-3
MNLPTDAIALSRSTRGDRPRPATPRSNLWKPPAGAAVRVVGAGAYVPPHAVTSAEIAEAIPGWSAEKIVEKTGIVERRFLWPLDVKRGCGALTPSDRPPEATTATDMGEIALSRALAMAELSPTAVDILIVVTCTPDQPRFSHDAMELQRRLGLRRDAHCFVVDSGCGGSLYVLDMLARMMAEGRASTAAIVGTNLTSSLLDRDVYTQEGILGDDGEQVRPYLSAYVFGDGAGALVLRQDPGSALGIKASVAGNEHWDLVRSPGGGTASPSYGPRYKPVDHAFIVNGRLVMSTYLETMRSCIEGVAEHDGRPLAEVERFYLHQPNDRLLRLLSGMVGLREGQLATNVARVGNTSSAGMFILVAEDLESGRVTLGSGVPVVLAAIGAGVHYGAQLVCL